MAALLMLVSPVSESVIHFDNFPRGGGQDFELSFFLILALLCLVLLAAVWGRMIMDLLLGEPEWRPHKLWEAVLRMLSYLQCDVLVWVPPQQALALGACTVPLRL